MIKLKVNKSIHHLPTRLHELTVGNFQRLSRWAHDDGHTLAGMVAALAGITEADALICSEIWHGRVHFSEIAEGIGAFVTSEPDRDIDFGGRAVKVREYRKLKVSQRVAMLDVYTKVGAGEPLEKHLHTILAIGVGHEFYGDEWPAEIGALSEVARDIPAKDGVPVAYFFGKGLAGLRKSGAEWVPASL